MERKDFIKAVVATAGIMSLSKLQGLSDKLTEQETKMPVLFIGHGSPMNAIEENEFTKGWRDIAKQIQQPKAILFISAHWLTRGTHVTAMQNPQTIHDFGGFPAELFAQQYPAPGDPHLAMEISALVKSTEVGLDQEWGLDHGSWSVAKPMYPDAKIPSLQLSIDYHKPASYHYALAKELAELRKKGVLIIGSGNMVHNLRMPDFSKPDTGYDWAIEMNEIFKTKIMEGDHTSLMNYEKLSPSARLAVPTPDHYYPLIYSLGLQEKHDSVTIFNDKATFGSITMTSLRIG
jgi:4,5-DOPA dioxygenase extradiol